LAHSLQEKYGDFINQEGSDFQTLNLQTSWQRVTLNRGMFPTNGSSTVVSLSSTIPGGDIDYARLNIRQKYYRPINEDFIFGFNIELGYLTAYGKTKETPFFQNFLCRRAKISERL